MKDKKGREILKTFNFRIGKLNYKFNIVKGTIKETIIYTILILLLIYFNFFR